MRLGLVCISEILRSKEKLHSRAMTRKRFLTEDRAVSMVELSARIAHNVLVLSKTIQTCHENGIGHLRVSSSIFPLVTDETLKLSYEDLPDIDSIISGLGKAGDLARQYDITLSCHPSQFNVLASLSEDTIRRSILQLNHESQVLDWLGCKSDYSSPMCLHLNRSPGVEEFTTQYFDRFCEGFWRCSKGVQNRLVLENEDKGYWSCENLYNTFNGFIPFVYDNLHDQCNPSSIPYSDQWAKLFKGTWGVHTPVFHWSEGIDGSNKHADYFTHVPAVVQLNKDVTWECEVKSKDKAICKIKDDKKFLEAEV